MVPHCRCGEVNRLRMHRTHCGRNPNGPDSGPVTSLPRCAPGSCGSRPGPATTPAAPPRVRSPPTRPSNLRTACSPARTSPTVTDPAPGTPSSAASAPSAVSESDPTRRRRRSSPRWRVDAPRGRLESRRATARVVHRTLAASAAARLRARRTRCGAGAAYGVPLYATAVRLPDPVRITARAPRKAAHIPTARVPVAARASYGTSSQSSSLHMLRLMWARSPP